MIADKLAKDQFAAIFGNKRGSSRGDDERYRVFDLFLPSGKAGFGQSVAPPASALQRADTLLIGFGGDPAVRIAAEVAKGWWVEVHTPGVPFGPGANDTAWEEFYDAFDGYSRDGVSCVFGDPDDGYFVTITPPS